MDLVLITVVWVSTYSMIFVITVSQDVHNVCSRSVLAALMVLLLNKTLVPAK